MEKHLQCKYRFIFCLNTFNKFVSKWRKTLAEVARNLVVTTSAIFNMLKRKNDKFN